jgi:S-formylglutathione hydrolase FrmB
MRSPVIRWGGFGALYLASQRPDYFGTAASFPGVIALTDPIIELGFSAYSDVWGPAGGLGIPSSYDPPQTEKIGYAN